MFPDESNQSNNSNNSNYPIQITQAIRSNLAGLSPAEKWPGFQYCRIDGQSLFCLEEGVADLRTGTPVTRTTTFNAFSVTKTFTSVAIMRLVDQHRAAAYSGDSLVYRSEWVTTDVVACCHAKSATVDLDL